jgi:hypothetical protein
MRIIRKSKQLYLDHIYHILKEHHPEISNKNYYAVNCVAVMADCSEIREMVNRMNLKV